ncbi:Fur family transcriptional regulator [Terasakiella sp. A23]|uniref:Fur family transcriptional regulator n=1 Tax=Terasakiella sp. FCG-A23 TaxID=3080561 RepID=UPI002954969D|nr:Fur family transcriptional regulator [Terasakiella sp. A23]MDV7340499.1 Fur family transcriptional regulator [Terasakiella sp. A23]
MKTTLTKNQQLVLDCLKRSDAPQTAYNLLDQLRDEGLRAPPQIYRALDKLMELELIHKLESLNAFVVCAHDHDHSGFSAFSICNDCGEVAEFELPKVSALLNQWSSRQAFVAETTTIEVRGHCSKCVKP